MNSEAEMRWRFEDRTVPVSSISLPYWYRWLDVESPLVNHAEFYGILRHRTRAYRCDIARILLTFTNPIFVTFVNFADNIAGTYRIGDDDYMQFLDLYVEILDAIDKGRRVSWQQEGF